MGFVYVLQCQRGPTRTLYVGSTLRPVMARVQEHAAGRGGKYTARFDAVTLVALLEVPRASARSVEMHLKRNWHLVPDVVAYCQEGTRRPSIDRLEEWLRAHAGEFKWRPVPARAGGVP